MDHPISEEESKQSAPTEEEARRLENMPEQPEQDNDIPQRLKEMFARFEKLGFKRVNRLKPGEMRIILNPPRRLVEKIKAIQSKKEKKD